PNGFDPVEWGAPVRPSWKSGQRFEIAYAGTFYSAARQEEGSPAAVSVRQPDGLFAALRRLAGDRAFGTGGVRVRFIGARAGTSDAASVRECARAHGLEEMVEVLPRL